MFSSNTSQSTVILLRVAVIGDSGAGKTTLIQRFAKAAFRQNLGATINPSFEMINADRQANKITLQVWDTPGQETLRELLYSNYSQRIFKKAHAVLLVCDITNRRSFENIPRHYSEVIKHIPRDTQIFLVGAKADLHFQRAVDIEELQNRASLLQATYIEVSAHDLTMVNELFDNVTDYWLYKLTGAVTGYPIPKPAPSISMAR